MSPRRFAPQEKWEILLEALGSANGPDETCFRRGITLQELRRWLTVAREGALQRLAQAQTEPITSALLTAAAQAAAASTSSTVAPPPVAPAVEARSTPVAPSPPPPGASSSPETPVAGTLPPQLMPAPSDQAEPVQPTAPPGPTLGHRQPMDPEQIDAMFSMVSHELKEPVRGVRALCQFLQEDLQGQLDEHAIGYLKMMSDSAVRMQSLVDGLGEYARVLRALKPDQPVDLGQVLRTLRHSLLPLLTARNATLMIDSRLPPVTGDPVALGLMFKHLLLNGLKFNTSPAPRLEVTVGVSPPSLPDQAETHIILVRDNGIGMDPRHFERAFELFQRLHRYELYPGAGVGLAVVRKVMDAHGGAVSLESVPGQGTTVRLSFPLVTDQVAPRQSQPV